MIHPTKKEFIELSGKGNLVPVYRELFGDLETPVGAFMKISKGSKYAFLLESVEGGEKIGRYTFLGADPKLVIKTSGNTVTRISGGDAVESTLTGDPLEEIKKIMSQYKPAPFEGLPPFYGGAVGMIGYDCVRFFERLPDVAQKDTDMPDIVFMITDSLVVFDNIARTIKVLVNAYLDEKTPEAVYDSAVAKINGIVKLLEQPLPVKEKLKAAKDETGFISNIGKETFKESVRRCKEYIREGDIFQVVMAQRLSIKLDVPAFDVYRALRTVNPSPYMYYLKLDDWEVVGASPEILSRAQNGKAVVRPIAGTRPRGKTESEDAALEKELLSDQKELAEHVMLVDLGRNDLGRVSEGGSVEVTEFKFIEKYSHVMHIVSNVEGRLIEGKDSFDVIRATFPAGTLSGAPKIRAMEIIEELEPTRRGFYGGAVGYFGFNGNMDTAITIRTLVIKNKTAYLGIGAGIVADSDPEREWGETMNKGRALLRAIEIARKGFL
ncbi:MAG: anthranilate synthase component I [bacterium]|nr:MAG: anthranilate synthase component I [bacterium]